MKQKPVMLGIIGCGAIAKQYHMPALKSLPDCTVAAVCDIVPERAAAAADYFGLPQERAYTSAEDLLSRKDIQGVLILTPNFNHCSITVLAARHKKHVFITKPMARTPAECEEMIVACRENGVQLFVSFMHRYLLGIEEAKRMLDEGLIGKVELVRVLNAPGATSTCSKWFYEKENVGGGCVKDIGVHGIDLVRYLIGDVEEVLYADTGRFRDEIFTDGETVRPNNEDHAIAVYRTTSGVLVNQVISWHHWSFADRFSMEIFGQGGSIFLRGGMGIVSICQVKPGETANWITPELSYSKLGDIQHQNFVEMIRNNGTANPDGAEGLACLRVAEAIYESAREKRAAQIG